jgi:hypothetical protein
MAIKLNSFATILKHARQNPNENKMEFHYKWIALLEKTWGRKMTDAERSAYLNGALKESNSV